MSDTISHGTHWYCRGKPACPECGSGSVDARCSQFYADNAGKIVSRETQTDEWIVLECNSCGCVWKQVRPEEGKDA